MPLRKRMRTTGRKILRDVEAADYATTPGAVQKTMIPHKMLEKTTLNEDGSAKHQIQGVLWRTDSEGLESPVCMPPHSTIHLPLLRKARGGASR